MDKENFAKKLAEEGKVFCSGEVRILETVPWIPHDTFTGVEMKTVVTAAQTGGVFRYYVVHIAPDKAIGWHVHPNEWESHEVIAGAGRCLAAEEEWQYTPGVLALLPPNVAHTVQAGQEGLYLLAKFIKAKA